MPPAEKVAVQVASGAQIDGDAVLFRLLRKHFSDHIGKLLVEGARKYVGGREARGAAVEIDGRVAVAHIVGWDAVLFGMGKLSRSATLLRSETGTVADGEIDEFL